MSSEEASERTTLGGTTMGAMKEAGNSCRIAVRRRRGDRPLASRYARPCPVGSGCAARERSSRTTGRMKPQTTGASHGRTSQRRSPHPFNPIRNNPRVRRRCRRRVDEQLLASIKAVQVSSSPLRLRDGRPVDNRDRKSSSEKQRRSGLSCLSSTCSCAMPMRSRPRCVRSPRT